MLGSWKLWSVVVVASMGMVALAVDINNTDIDCVVVVRSTGQNSWKNEVACRVNDTLLSTVCERDNICFPGNNETLSCRHLTIPLDPPVVALSLTLNCTCQNSGEVNGSNIGVCSITSMVKVLQTDITITG